MSSKSSKKNVAVTKSTNAIITRNKSAQQNRRVRAKNKKTVKPIVTKESQKPAKKSTNSPSATCREVTPLQAKVRHLVQLVEQVEYYPDKLKRNAGPKKFFLKPKPNLKVIATANKRKSVVPQKGAQYLSLSKDDRKVNKTSCSSEVSMIDMVTLIQDTHSLSDEDFMEILTCPSPVWWEDPPDEGYFEDAIFTRHPSPSPPVSQNPDVFTKTEEQNTRRMSTPINIIPSLTDFENEIEKFQITLTKSNTSEKFNEKKAKLESVLGNIKTVKQIESKTNLKNLSDKSSNKVINKIENKTSKTDINNISSNTDEEDLSDLSFNEEDILKNLENMDIPIEQAEEQNTTQNKVEIDIQETTKIKNKIVIIKPNRSIVIKKPFIPDVLPPLKRKPDIKINKIASEYSENLDYNLDALPHSNFRFISDDDISLVQSNKVDKNLDKELKIVNISSTLGESSSNIEIDTDSKNDESIELEGSNTDNSDKNNVSNSNVSDLITVYKIMTNDCEINSEISNKSPDTSINKVENVRGKLNSFFKKCKSSKRIKKIDTHPANAVKDIKNLNMEKENSDAHSKGEENRFNVCDYCVEKTENGTKNFSCEKCENTPKFTCALCNFLADTKDLYKKHVSNCKDVARITWKNNYIMNQT